jgi:hypothetical protein
MMFAFCYQDTNSLERSTNEFNTSTQYYIAMVSGNIMADDYKHDSNTRWLKMSDHPDNMEDCSSDGLNIIHHSSPCIELADSLIYTRAWIQVTYH